MNIRSASFRDLAGIEQLYRGCSSSETETPPLAEGNPIPQATLLRLWYGFSRSISSLVPLSDAPSTLLVAEDDGKIVGFVQAETLTGVPKAWRIINLCTGKDRHSHFARDRLLTALCNRAIESGIGRLHVRLPEDHLLVPLFLEQGFTQFATEQILFREDVDDIPRATLSDLRPAHRDDVAQLYLLYRRTTPSHVAGIEAPTQKMWQTMTGTTTPSRIGRDGVKHLVAERTGVYGWASMRVSDGPHPTVLSLMCDGRDANVRDPLVDAVLSELPPGPVTSVLRHYDSELIRALQHRGFAIYGTQLLMVRDLAAKVKLRAPSSRKKAMLAPAGIARSVPVADRIPLHVLHPMSEKGTKRSLRK